MIGRNIKYLIVAVLAVLAVGVSFADEAQTEVTGSASYFKPDGGNSSWSLNGEIAFPLSSGAYILAGPSFEIINGEDDFQAFGAVIEWNLFGKASGFFVSGAGLYDPDAPEGRDSYTLDARAGGKLRIGKSKSGLIKAYAEKTVDGYGESEDLRGVVAIGFALGN